MSRLIFTFPASKSKVSISPRETGKGVRIKGETALNEFPFGQIPDSPNPRTHSGMKCLRSRSAKRIEKTLMENPKAMGDLNKGLCITAHEDTVYNSNKEEVTVIIENERHGILDGGTTDRVAAEEIHRLTEAGKPLTKLAQGSIHWEIITGIRTAEELAKISEAHNLTQPQKFWSLATLKGELDWLRNILDVFLALLLMRKMLMVPNR